jgi:hypothetical protein
MFLFIPETRRWLFFIIVFIHIISYGAVIMLIFLFNLLKKPVMFHSIQRIRIHKDIQLSHVLNE